MSKLEEIKARHVDLKRELDVAGFPIFGDAADIAWLIAEVERLESFVSGTKGKRLTYKALIQ